MRLPLAATSAALLSVACATSAPPAAPPAVTEKAVVEMKSTGTPGQATAVRTQTLDATVKSVDVANRTVTLEWNGGETQTVKAGPEVKRFAEIAAGDAVQVDLEQELRLEFQPPGTPSVPFTVTAGGARGSTTSGAPGGVIGAGIQATVTITAIDLGTRRVIFQDPAGSSYEVSAVRTLQIEKLKVGDRLLATYTEATAIRLVKAAR